MAVPFNLTDLNSVLGDYFRENTSEVVLEKLYSPGNFDPQKPMLWDIVERMPVYDEKAWAEANFAVEVQDRANAYSSQGNVVTVKGRTIKLRSMRADFQIDWRAVYGSWLNHIRKQSYTDTYNLASLSASMHAFADWIFRGVIDKFFENLWLKTSMKGVYSSGFNSTASYGAAADGWLQLITADLALGTPNIPAAQTIAAGGPLTSGNTFTHLEAMGKAIPAKLDGINMFALMATENADNYNDGFLTNHEGANPRIHDNYNRVRLQSRPQVAITPVREMDGSDRVILTPQDNLIFGTNFGEMPPQAFTSVAADPTVINVTLEYGVAFGIRRYDELIVNDQA